MIEGTLRSGTEPQIPIKAVGDWFRFFGSLDRLRPEWPAGPINDLAHGPNGAVPDPLAEQPGIFRGLIRDGDLSCHSRLSRNLGNAP
jgi:hypothetical protein